MGEKPQITESLRGPLEFQDLVAHDGAHGSAEYLPAESEDEGEDLAKLGALDTFSHLRTCGLAVG